MTEPKTIESTPLTIKSVVVLAGSVIVPIVGFAVLSIGQLNEITTELRLLRNDVSQLQNGALEADDFDAWVDILRAQNPDMGVPSPRRRH